MKICILGNDTLAEATLVCCKRHFEVSYLIAKTGDGEFTSHQDGHLDLDCAVIWVAYDTPLAANGEPDTEWVMNKIREDLRHTPEDILPLILISSQMPVGTTALLEKEFPQHAFAYQPENIRVASAVADFENQSRVVVGRRNTQHDEIIEELFTPFTKQLIFTDPETAEMTKHALNTWLGMNIAFANEMGRLCDKVGADMTTITKALRSDARVSPKTPLMAGAPFGGGHLARDIFVLNQLAEKHAISVPIIAHIAESNGGLK